MREVGPQDFLARERKVPATERLKLLERSVGSGRFRPEDEVSSSLSSGERENLLAEVTLRFIFREVRRKTSTLGMWLSPWRTEAFDSDERLRALSEKFRLKLGVGFSSVAEEPR